MIVKYLITGAVWALANQNKYWQLKLAGTSQLSSCHHPYYLF